MSGGSTNPTNGPFLYANLTSNTETYTFDPSKVAGYTAGNTTATLTILDNVYLYSNSISTPALTVSGWNANDTIYVINKGYIMGRGGDGGTYGGELGTVAATNGGTAMSISSNTTLFNFNTIAGGGGGGAAANRSTTGSGGGGAGGGYGGSVFGGGVGAGTEIPATLSNIISLAGGFDPLNPPSFLNPSASIVVSSVGGIATTHGTESGGTSPLANNAYIKINGTKITCRDRTGQILYTKPPKIGNAGDTPLSSRGINVVVLNQQSLAVESAICYDTWNDSITKDLDALLVALQNIPNGRIVVMTGLDAYQMNDAIANILTNNYGAPTTNPKTWARDNSQSRRALVFIGQKGAQPLSSLYQITAADINAMIFASAAFTAGSSGGGSIAIGGAGGSIGNTGSNGSIVTSDTGAQYGSGGGGGRIVNGTGGNGGNPGVDVRGFGGGTGGGGGGANGGPAQAIGGKGGDLNLVGSNANPVATTDGGGGGGGWGASGGIGSIFPATDVVSVGLGGKAIEKNGRQLIIAAPGTLYGTVV